MLASLVKLESLTYKPCAVELRDLFLLMSQNQRYKSIQLLQLRSFCLAATKGNFTAAAMALGLSKATVWQQVRSLERTLKASLLTRRGRAVQLTPAGQVLLDMVQPHVLELTSLERCFEMRRGELPQTLTVASNPYVLSYHLPQAIREFSAAHPSILFKFLSETPREALRRVGQGEADLGIVPYFRNEPSSLLLEYENLFDVHFYLMTARDHPLASRKRIQPADLVRYPLIRPEEGSLSLVALEKLLSQDRLNEGVHFVLVTHNLDMTRQFVAMGVGIALGYLGSKARRMMPELHLRLWQPAPQKASVAVVVRKAAHLPASVQEFRQAVRKACAERK